MIFSKVTNKLIANEKCLLIKIGVEMKKWLLGLALAVSLPALAAVPTDASIKALLQITDSKTMIDQSMGQIDQYMELGLQEVIKDKEITPEMQKQINIATGEMSGLLKDEFSWQKFEPMLIEIYRKSFSQSDIDGMLAFYKTEAGQSVVKKMPLVMQNTMQLMQERMQQVMPKMMRIAEQSIEQPTVENKNQ
jgi:hypothetical protein